MARCLLWLLVISTFLTGCTAIGTSSSAVPPVNTAISQALQHTATSWDLLARTDDPDTGEYAVIYRARGSYGFLEARAGGQWSNDVLGTPPNVLVLDTKGLAGRHVGFIGGLVGEKAPIVRIEVTFPWTVLDIPVHDKVFLASVTLQEAGKGFRFIQYPIPFKAFDANGKVLVEGTAPYYEIRP